MASKSTVMDKLEAAYGQIQIAMDTFLPQIEAAMDGADSRGDEELRARLFELSQVALSAAVEVGESLKTVVSSVIVMARAMDEALELASTGL